MQRLPGMAAFRHMNAVTREKDLSSVIYAVQDFLNKLASYTTSVLTMAKDLLSVLTAAVDLHTVTLATVIRSAVDVLGSRSMRSACNASFKLKALISSVRSLFGSIGAPGATSG